MIPEETDMQFYIRAPTLGELTFMNKKIVKCFEAAATSTGCQVNDEILYWCYLYNIYIQVTKKPKIIVSPITGSGSSFWSVKCAFSCI